jgi:hypothetical protein
MRKNFRIHISRIGGVLSFGKKAEAKALIGRNLLFSTIVTRFKERLFMFALFLLLIFCAGIILPGIQRWYRLEGEIMQLRDRLSRTKAYQTIAKDNPITQPVISGDSKNVDLADALLLIQQLANTSGVSIESIKPNESIEARVKSVSYTVTPIELSIYCQEPSLARFMAGLEKCKFLARISSISVSPDARNEGMIRGRIKLEKIDLVSFQANDMKSAIWNKKADLKEGRGVDYQKQDEAHFSVIANKRLFKSPEESKSKNIQPMEDRKDFLQDINLVGIMDDQGRKAIVEDKKTSKTYYLSVGDSISGMKVSEIKENEVVLEKDGTSYNLVL